MQLRSANVVLVHLFRMDHSLVDLGVYLWRVDEYNPERYSVKSKERIPNVIAYAVAAAQECMDVIATFYYEQ